MNPQITIIIPTYNRKDELENTINSVLDQTHQEFELLICDDGSTDGTEEMVKKLTDPRIHWISGENSGGPATPRNRGINAANAEWLAFLDSDDLWSPNKLEKQLEALKMYQVKAVCTNAKVLQDNTLLQDPYFKNTKNKYIHFEDLLTVNYIICSSMLIHKSIVKQVGGFPEESEFKAIEDYALWLSSSMLTDVYYLDEPLTIYRDEPEKSIRGEVKESELIKSNRIMMECLRRTSHISSNHIFRLKLLLGLFKKNIKRVL